MKSEDGKVTIPRGTRRTYLAESGLIGKIQFTSDMSAQDICDEICRVFATPMGLEVEETKHFPFSYLQRTGAGSRSLCLPAVSPTFVYMEWSPGCYSC